jgi:hypothetical protein
MSSITLLATLKREISLGSLVAAPALGGSDGKARTRCVPLAPPTGGVRG